MYINMTCEVYPEKPLPCYVIVPSTKGYVYRNTFRNILNVPIIHIGAEATLNSRHNLGYPTENTGVATFSGDGVATEFNIASHGLAENPTDPSRILAVATAVSADAQAAAPLTVYPVDLDADGAYEALRVKFASAPAAGTDNVKVRWKAELD